MRDGYLRGALSPRATQRQMDVLAAYVAAGGSVQDAAELVGIRPSTVKRHLADLRARSGLTTEQLIYAGRARGWLVVPSLERAITEARSGISLLNPYLGLGGGAAKIGSARSQSEGLSGRPRPVGPSPRSAAPSTAIGSRRRMK